MKTKDRILNRTTYLFSRSGAEGVSIRDLAKDLKIAPSVIYHHFEGKSDLLESMYIAANQKLGQDRQKLDPQETLEDRLRQIITFQLQHIENIVAVLKYYLTFRKSFEQNHRGFLPEKSYLHADEILTIAQEKNEYSIPDIHMEAKIITHTINGFLLEYFPSPILKQTEQEVVDRLTHFFLRALNTYKTA